MNAEEPEFRMPLEAHFKGIFVLSEFWVLKHL